MWSMCACALPCTSGPPMIGRSITLVSEILDNSIDEAVAGHAGKITVAMFADGSIKIGDNGRGIPTAAHKNSPTNPQ